MSVAGATTPPGSNAGRFWDAIVDFHRAKDGPSGSTAAADSGTVIFAGGDGAGKSTLLASFASKTTRPAAAAASSSGDPRPTLGLDYRFVRAGSSSSSAGAGARTVHHLWEIGGGRPMAPALPALLTDQAAVLVVVDLSRPASAVADLLFWLPQVRAAADAAGRRQPPVAVVANKYDRLAAGVDAGLLFGTIRAVAVGYGAAVVCHGAGQRALQQQIRGGIGRLLAGRPMIVPGPGQADDDDDDDPSRPIALAAGADSLDRIGLPAAGGAGGAGTDPVRAWLRAFQAVFGPVADPAPAAPDADLEPEPLVDAAL